jgi:hypothetical protein
MIESMTSHVSVNSAIDPTSVRPASRASVLLRALRLSSAVQTLNHFCFSCSATAWPMSPGLMTPIFSIFMFFCLQMAGSAIVRRV